MKILMTITAYPPSIGGATGEFCNIAAQNGWQAELLELSIPFINEAYREFGIIAHNKTLEESHFQPRSFDLVAMFHVLEHIPDPIMLLGEIKNILKSRGMIAFCLPNLYSFTDRFWGKLNLNINMVDHLFHYSQATLERILSKIGFEIVVMKTHESAYHWVTTMYGIAGSVIHKNKTIETREVKINLSKSQRIKKLLPYYVGNIVAPITFPFRWWLEKTGYGHEIMCIAQKRD